MKKEKRVFVMELHGNISDADVVSLNEFLILMIQNASSDNRRISYKLNEYEETDAGLKKTKDNT